ncbi:MAG TPA: TonB family protein [Burkholderiaceae bacterium]|nr:TonB family protein [Burkholderiaceae bacterium]
MKSRRATWLLIAGLSSAACTAPPPPSAPVSQPAPPPAPVIAPKPNLVVPNEPPAPARVARLAPLNPTLESWKQRAAERIQQINRKSLFEGRPEHLLRAVVVVELTVDRDGKITNSKIMRSPGIGELDIAALRSLRAASPLPAPPSSLLVRGALVYQETWLFRKDGRFQLRSLALAQE